MKWAATYDKGGLISEANFHFCSILKKKRTISLSSTFSLGSKVENSDFEHVLEEERGLKIPFEIKPPLKYSSLKCHNNIKLRYNGELKV